MPVFGLCCHPEKKDLFIPKSLNLSALHLHPGRKSLAIESDFASGFSAGSWLNRASSPDWENSLLSPC